jgi:predicted amidohydrolase
MKIAAAQTKPFKGDINRNIEQHWLFTAAAAARGAGLVFFSELSLSGYETALAKELATQHDDYRFDALQEVSDSHKIAIAAGMPIRSNDGVMIGMLIFQPGKERQLYAKQTLHEDELPFFVNGQQQVYIELEGHKIAPAICYESMLPEYAEKVVREGAQIFMASVAKSADGIERGHKHYAEMAKQHSIPVIMSNCIGTCDNNYVCTGSSAVWNKQGALLAQLGVHEEGILVFDTETEDVTVSLFEANKVSPV